MSNNAATFNVAGTMFQGISELLRQANVSPTAFYHSFSLPLNIESSAQQLVPFELFLRVLASLTQQTNIQHPGLAMAKIQSLAQRSPYIELLHNAPNICTMMLLAGRFRDTYSEVTYWDWQVDGDFVMIERRTLVPISVDDRQHSLYTIAMAYQLIKYISGADDSMRISLIQREDQHSIELAHFFSCPVSFGQDFDGYIMPIDTFYRPHKQFIASHYQRLLTRASAQAIVFSNNQKFSNHIKSLILQTLSTGHCRLLYIAQLSNLHPRALQKRLAQEGLTFKVILADVRMNLAKRLLVQHDVSLTKISLILGYSEPSAFSRAFQAYQGCSPRQWRGFNQ